jgi:hypothetical protein
MARYGKAASLFFLFLLLSACTIVRQGSVIEKGYSPGGFTVNIIPDANGNLTTQLVYESETWWVRLSDDQELGVCYITKAQWEQVAIGDYVFCNPFQIRQNYSQFPPSENSASPRAP